MIISYYGKKFLKKYNEVNKTNLTSKDFFIDVFYPIFFDDEKYLMRVQNSPFDQHSNKKFKKTVEGRKKIFNDFFEEINEGRDDSSFFVGGKARDLINTSSFNVALEYDGKICEEEILYSWIGYALSIQLKGMKFILDDDEILYDIYLGWIEYRKLLSDPLYKDYSDHQISTWNSLWLNNVYSPREFKENKFNPFDKNEKLLESPSFVSFLFNLSNKFSGKTINSYAFRIDKSNNTYGNVTFHNKKIKGFLNFCQEYFGENEFLNSSKLYEEIYGTAYGIDKLCEMGSLGVNSLKPRLLMLEELKHKTEKNKKEIKTHYKKLSKNENIFKLYKIYLMAILNDKKMYESAIEIAESLYSFQHETRKNDGLNLVKRLLSSYTIESVNKTLADMMEICDDENLTEFSKVLVNILDYAERHKSNIKNLITLLKFNFHKISLNKKNNINI